VSKKLMEGETTATLEDAAAQGRLLTRPWAARFLHGLPDRDAAGMTEQPGRSGATDRECQSAPTKHGRGRAPWLCTMEQASVAIRLAQHVAGCQS
jgi:hypothetical protein